jgi:hypothetical protein
MSGMFNGAKLFNQDLGGWDVGALEAAWTMFVNSGLSSENYGALLRGWADQTTQADVTFEAVGIQYPASAADARAVLTDDRGWTISDGGLAP